MIPGSAAIAAAVEDAERQRRPGMVITAMPISPSQLFELRSAAGPQEAP